ncbi:3'-5' exonuclease [Hydrogenibacillus sp. N12]|uniref:3'-5' exonuclease n=1 Tax=Hydrogenibacillus sp. N12 TaxID=2866627 RepID=UPI001C7CA76D|nr:3'-5' exonuclease [Hydrogenibacillus sp. N12]QZA33244.1 3'-5' exonuclease [Hydrogenibacillus sp. N12]
MIGKDRNEGLPDKIVARISLNMIPQFIPRIEGGPLPNQFLALIIDIETTGLNPKIDEIIEFAGLLVVVDGEKGTIEGYLDAYAGLQEPSRQIPEKVSQINGLKKADLIGLKFDSERIKRLIDQADVLISHNVRFDKKFISKIYRRDNIKSLWLDTLIIDWHRICGAQNRRLDTLRSIFGIDNLIPHSALGDVLSLVLILRNVINGFPVSKHIFTERLFNMLRKKRLI